jgi:hypothetical protein
MYSQSIAMVGGEICKINTYCYLTYNHSFGFTTMESRVKRSNPTQVSYPTPNKGRLDGLMEY